MADNKGKPLAEIHTREELDAVLTAVHESIWNSLAERPAVEFLLRYWPDDVLPSEWDSLKETLKQRP